MIFRYLTSKSIPIEIFRPGTANTTKLLNYKRKIYQIFPLHIFNLPTFINDLQYSIVSLQLYKPQDNNDDLLPWYLYGFFITSQRNTGQCKCSPHPQKKDKYRREGKGRRCCLGDELIQLHAALQLFCTMQDDFKKRMNTITASWGNGCFEKMDDHLVNTTPNHQN